MSIYKYLGCSTAVMAGVMLTWVAPTKAFLYPVAPAATSYIQHVDCAAGFHVGPVGTCVIGTDEPHDRSWNGATIMLGATPSLSPDRMRRETAKRKRRQTADVPPTTFEEVRARRAGLSSLQGFFRALALANQSPGALKIVQCVRSRLSKTS